MEGLPAGDLLSGQTAIKSYYFVIAVKRHKPTQACFIIQRMIFYKDMIGKSVALKYVTVAEGHIKHERTQLKKNSLVILLSTCLLDFFPIIIKKITTRS